MRAEAGLVAVSEAGADVVARADVLREARYGYVRAVRRTWCFSRRRFGDFLGEGWGRTGHGKPAARSSVSAGSSVTSAMSRLSSRPGK